MSEPLPKHVAEAFRALASGAGGYCHFCDGLRGKGHECVCGFCKQPKDKCACGWREIAAMWQQREEEARGK